MKFESLFDGKYKIIRSLGGGGSGHVYLAENTRVGNLWAIKEITVTTENKAIIEQEIEVLKSIRHRALPGIADVIRDDDHIYIVEDYIEGETVEARICRSCGHGIEEGAAVSWALDICDIMMYLHGQKPAPVIYRDLKPSNIVISHEGAICLVDFGSARMYKPGFDNDTVYIGTRGYAAPEQYGSGQTSVRSDVFSFGVTMLHILSGKAPHEQNCSPSDYGIKPDLLGILRKCTMSLPSDRYGSFADIKAALLAYWSHNESSLPSERYKFSLQPDKSLGPVGLCRCTTISVIKNHEFAFEMSLHAARKFGAKVLIIDLDFETSITGWYFGEGGQKREQSTVTALTKDNGLLLAAELATRAEQTNAPVTMPSIGGLSGLTWQSPYHPNVFILCETRSEHAVTASKILSKDDGRILSRILCEFTGRVDLCVLLTGSSAFGKLNGCAFRNSHYIVCPDAADIPSIRSFNNTAALAGRLADIPEERFKYVSWGIRPGETAASEAALWELPEHTHAGVVRHSKKRDASRFEICPGRCYAIGMEKAVQRDYDAIIRAFQIA